MNRKEKQPMAEFDPVKYKQTTRDQWQAAAQAWNRWEPVLEQWLATATEQMLDLADLREGSHVLDLAAGTGGQSVAAARRVGPTGSVLATDIAPDILAFVAANAHQAGVSTIEAQMMDAEHLELEDGRFDAVISRLGLMYLPNWQQALREIYRVLEPGGRMAAIVFSVPQDNPFFSIPISIIRRRAQLPPPAPGQPGPFSFGAPGVLEDVFQGAGFRDIVASRVAAPVRLASSAECVRFERESFGALHQMMAGLAEAEREEVWNEIAQELRAFEGANGFEGPCTLLVAGARK
jgi:SAM-dependent methyltransferase